MTHAIRLKTVLVLLVTCLPATGDDDQEKLPRSLQRDVEETLVPAVRQNNAAAVAESAGTLLRRAGDEHAGRLDAFLNLKGLPDCGSLLLEARMVLDARRPKTGSRSKNRTGLAEARSLLTTLDARIRELSADSSDELTVTAFQQSAGTFKDYASFLSDVYRSGSRQQDIIRLCRFAGRFVESEKGLLSRISDPEVQALGSAERFNDHRRAAKKRFDALVETELELRLQRLQKAGSVLADPDAAPAERLVAAFPARLDATYLPQTLPDRGIADDSDEARALLQLADGVRQNAGDLWDRSYRFYVGLDWWRRGRFGRGRFAGGMMKGFDALQSLDRQIALSMPEEFPEITETSQSSVRVDQYPLSRRHRYHWQIEPPKGAEFKARKWFG